MPVEARYVVFSLDETEGLMRRFAHARSLDLPEGRLVRVEEAADGYRFTFQNDFSRKRTLTLNASVVIAAVLLDCRHQRLPVARHFDKRIEASGTTLTLVATSGCDAVPVAEALQVRMALA